MKAKMLAAASIFILLVGGGLVYIFLQQQQEQPQTPLFTQVDFDVEHKKAAVDRMDWSTGKAVYQYVALTEAQQQEILRLFEGATFEKMDAFPEDYDYSITLNWNTRHRLFIDLDAQAVVDPENTTAYRITSNAQEIVDVFNALQ